MNILFICKYNRFRSKVAEAYFNKVKKTNKLKAKSAGLVPGIPINKEIFKSTKKMGLKISNKPIGINHQLLMWSNKIIIIATNIPTSVFNEEKRNDGKEIIHWKIQDVGNSNRDTEKNIKTIKTICNKVDKLLKVNLK